MTDRRRAREALDHVWAAIDMLRVAHDSRLKAMGDELIVCPGQLHLLYYRSDDLQEDLPCERMHANPC